MMWRREKGWKGKKREFERNEGTIESIVEGVAQSFIASFIIIQKYVEKNEEYGYRDPDLGSAATDKRHLVICTPCKTSATGKALASSLSYSW